MELALGVKEAFSFEVGLQLNIVSLKPTLKTLLLSMDCTFSPFLCSYYMSTKGLDTVSG